MKKMIIPLSRFDHFFCYIQIKGGVTNADNH